MTSNKEKKLSLQELKQMIQDITKEVVLEHKKRLQESKENSKQELTLESLRKVIRKLIQEEKWMQKAVHPSKKGAFTAKAKRHGMSVAEFAKHVLAHSEDFPKETVNQAKFAKAAKKIAKS